MKQASTRILSDVIVLAAAISVALSTCGVASAQSSVSQSLSIGNDVSTAISTKPDGSVKTQVTVDLSALEARQAKIKEDIMKAKEARDAKLAEAKEAFEKKIAEIKDTQKQEVAKNLQEQINTINDNRTDSYIMRLDGLDEVVVKLESRVDKAKTAGEDTTAINTKIEALKTKIEALREKIKTQQEKAYVVEIKSTKSPGQDFKKTLTLAKTDLTALRNDVKSLKQEVLEVFKLVKDLGDTATSASPTPASTASPAN